MAHKVGDLYSSQSADTPYRPTNVTKLNSYICSNHSSSRSSSSLKNKRVRLFQVCLPDVEENSNKNEGTTLSQMTVDMQLLIAKHDRAVAERDAACANSDKAQEEKAAACADRDSALHERDKARVERNAALHEKDFASHERDLTFAGRTCQVDIAMKDRDKLLKQISNLSCEVQMLESRYNKLMSENANLAEEMRRKDEMFSSYAEHQACLAERVCNLEAQQSIQRTTYEIHSQLCSCSFPGKAKKTAADGTV